MIKPTNRIWGTWLVLGLWAVLLSAYWLFGRHPRYALRVFQTEAGWVYEIRQGAKPLIYQPVVPGLSGQQRFTDEAHARRVGERVLSKLQQGEFPPTLRPEEVR
ncbi:DUF4907 domain-containing protein [Fibrisoma limi]|nr:DUF4907 domain-containing protein [Fibrisoma limi]